MRRRIRPAPSVASPSSLTGCAPTAGTTPDARPSKLSSLQALGVSDLSRPIYELALTHRSFAYEQPKPIEHNERLEFLGDAILGAVVTDYIFRTYPHLSEGEMARLRAAVVNTTALAEVASDLGVGDHLRLGKGEGASGGGSKPSLLADTFEALVGAVYLEEGMEAIEKTLIPLFEDRITQASADEWQFDAKTILQERVVKYSGGFPAYRIRSWGPDHAKQFAASVYVDEDLYGEGEGFSKKEAEQNAAREALERLEREESERQDAPAS